MLDFSDRTRTGISKLISRCALETHLMTCIFAGIQKKKVESFELKPIKPWVEIFYDVTKKTKEKETETPSIRPLAQQAPSTS